MNHQQTEYLWPIKTNGGKTVFVPADLDQMTTYVLLEQQDWFEEEISFVRKLTPLCSHMSNQAHDLLLELNHPARDTFFEGKARTTRRNDDSLRYGITLAPTVAHAAQSRRALATS